MTPPPATPSLPSFPPVVSGNPSSSLTSYADGRNRPRTPHSAKSTHDVASKAKKIPSARHPPSCYEPGHHPLLDQTTGKETP